ncbi:MAG TPA: SNF2-related protein [bacterium]|nr:SNF2-related protein [bacterium]
MNKFAIAEFTENSRFGRIDFVNGNWIIRDMPDKIKMDFVKMTEHKDSNLPIEDFYYCLKFNWFAKFYNLALPPELRNKFINQLNAQLSKAKEIEELNNLSGNEFNYGEKLYIPLRNYQKLGVRSVLVNKRMIIGDDVGLGKTIVSIVALLESKAYPALFVSLTHLPFQIIREFFKFTDAVGIDVNNNYHDADLKKIVDFKPSENTVKIHYIKGTKPYPLPKADVYVTKYTCISNWVETLKTKSIKYLVLDECQELRHNTSKKYNGTLGLVNECEFVVGLSATPMYNYPIEIFSLYKLIKPVLFPDFYTFSKNWLTYNFRINKDVLNSPDEFGNHLRDRGALIRRTRDDVNLELPEIQQIIEYIETDSELINQERNNLIELAKKTLYSLNSEERAISFRQFDIKLRRTTGLAKAEAVASRVKIMVESGESVLLVGWHREVYEKWNEILKEYKPVMITGSETTEMKKKNIETFISGKSKIMIISLRSALGIDGLQSVSSIIVFGELDWTPQIHYQTIGRLRRFGQKKNMVIAYFLLANDGFDPVIEPYLQIKNEQSFKMMNPEIEYSPDFKSDAAVARMKEIAAKYLEKQSVSLEDAENEFNIPIPAYFNECYEKIKNVIADNPGFKGAVTCIDNLKNDLLFEIIRYDEKQEVFMFLYKKILIVIKTKKQAQKSFIKEIEVAANSEKVCGVIIITVNNYLIPERIKGRKSEHINLVIDENEIVNKDKGGNPIMKITESIKMNNFDFYSGKKSIADFNSSIINGLGVCLKYENIFLREILKQVCDIPALKKIIETIDIEKIKISNDRKYLSAISNEKFIVLTTISSGKKNIPEKDKRKSENELFEYSDLSLSIGKFTIFFFIDNSMSSSVDYENKISNTMRELIKKNNKLKCFTRFLNWPDILKVINSLLTDVDKKDEQFNLLKDYYRFIKAQLWFLFPDKLLRNIEFINKSDLDSNSDFEKRLEYADLKNRLYNIQKKMKSGNIQEYFNPEIFMKETFITSDSGLFDSIHLDTFEYQFKNYLMISFKIGEYYEQAKKFFSLNDSFDLKEHKFDNCNLLIKPAFGVYKKNEEYTTSKFPDNLSYNDLKYFFQRISESCKRLEWRNGDISGEVHSIIKEMMSSNIYWETDVNWQNITKNNCDNIGITVQFNVEILMPYKEAVKLDNCLTNPLLTRELQKILTKKVFGSLNLKR